MILCFDAIFIPLHVQNQTTQVVSGNIICVNNVKNTHMILRLLALFEKYNKKVGGVIFQRSHRDPPTKKKRAASTKTRKSIYAALYHPLLDVSVQSIGKQPDSSSSSLWGWPVSRRGRRKGVIGCASRRHRFSGSAEAAVDDDAPPPPTSGASHSRPQPLLPRVRQADPLCSASTTRSVGGS